jgi:hypothetical protein
MSSFIVRARCTNVDIANSHRGINTAQLALLDSQPCLIRSNLHGLAIFTYTRVRRIQETLI